MTTDLSFPLFSPLFALQLFASRKSKVSTPGNLLPSATSISLQPQYPRCIGVPGLVLELDGEVVDRVDPHIGFLHRGTLIEAGDAPSPGDPYF